MFKSSKFTISQIIVLIMGTIKLNASMRIISLQSQDLYILLVIYLVP
jgi:hypothetical protein